MTRVADGLGVSVRVSTSVYERLPVFASAQGLSEL